jgi:hypothetical protein
MVAAGPSRTKVANVTEKVRKSHQPRGTSNIARIAFLHSSNQALIELEGYAVTVLMPYDLAHYAVLMKIAR